MNLQETGRILAIAVTYDQRLKPPTDADAMARVQAWAAALDNDMAADYAEQTVVRHYAEKTTTIMPADLNHSWREYRRAVLIADRKALEEQQRKALEAQAVPPTPEFRAAVAKFRKRSA